MNMKTTKFLAVLAVMVMAFAAIAVVSDDSVEGASPITDKHTVDHYYIKADTSGGVALSTVDGITITDGETIKVALTKSVTLYDIITEAATTTTPIEFDLKGNTLTIETTGGHGIEALGAALTVKNGTIIITVDSDKQGTSATDTPNLAIEAASITMKDLEDSVFTVNYVGFDNVSKKGAGLYAYSGNLEIENSEILIYANDRGLYTNSGTVTIKGTSDVSIAVGAYGIRTTNANVSIADTAEVTISIDAVEGYTATSTKSINAGEGPLTLGDKATLVVNEGMTIAAAISGVTFDAADKNLLEMSATSSSNFTEGKGIDGGKWTFSTSTLTLDGYDGNGFFKTTGALTVVTKANTSNYIYAETADSEGAIMGGTVIIKNENTTKAGYLSIEQGNVKGFGVNGNSVTIGDTGVTDSTTLYTKFASEGGAQAIYSATTVSFCNADVDVSAGERGIRATTNLTTTGYNDIIAEIDGSFNVNGQGDDDIWGIKVGGTATVNENTIILTDGMRVIGSGLTNSGTIYVHGDYIQNPGAAAKLAVFISGLYLDAYATALPVTKISAPSLIDEKGLYFVGDVDYYVPATTVTVTDADSGEIEQQVNATTNQNIVDAIDAAKTAGADSLVVNVTSAIGDLAVTTGPEQSLELRTIGTSAKLTGEITVTGETATDTNKVKIKDLKGFFGFSYGSIVMNIIEWDGGDITLTDGEVLKITGDTPIIAGEVSITGPADGSATVISDEDQTLVITGTLTLTGNVKMNNDGAITGNGTIDVDEDAQFYSSKPVSVYFTGDGKILVDDATETIRLNGNYNSQNSYTATQKVIVDGNLTIAPNSYIIINGGLEVQEGVTITIQDGGQLRVQSVTAYADIYGTIKSSSENGFYVASSVDGDVNIYGDVIAAKATNDDVITVTILGEAKLTGTMTVNSKAAAYFDELTIADEGVLTVNGQIKGEFNNGNLVVFNGEVYDNGTATIYAKGTGATVQVNAVKAGTLVVSDEGMYLGKYEGTKYYVTSENVISFRNISDVTVIEGITFYLDDDDQPVYTNYSYISGEATVADSKITGIYAPVMTVVDGKATVSTEFGINYAYVAIAADAEMTVTGTAQVDNPSAAYLVGLYVDDEGSLKVSGFLKSATNAIDEEDAITAVMYTEKVDSTTYYCYTNLADAIASGAKDLTVLGDLYITKNTTIPAGIDIDATGKDVYVGDNENIDVVLLIEDKGSLTAKTVTVDGTMVIENADSGIVCSTIYSDVSNIGEPDAIYTNIYTALATAEEGDVVKITSKTGTVTISRNVTIPEGVTLLIPTNKTLEIEDSYTLTVAGTLQNKGIIDAETAFAEEADDETSAIAVTGLIESMTELDFATYQIPGAYYEYKALYEITSVANSGVAILIANDKTMDIYGTELAIGSVSYAGTEQDSAIVNFKCSVVSGEVTLSNAKLNLVAAAAGVGYYNMTVSGENGSVVLAYAQVKDTAAVIEAETEDDVEYIGITAGKFAAASVNAEGQFPYISTNSQKMTFDGLFYIANATIFKPTIKGALEFTDNVAINGKTTVSGSMIIDNDVAVTAADNVTVTGSIAAMPATSTEAKGTLAITGTLYIGGSSSVFTTKTVTVSADAYVSGDVSATLSYYIFPGATVEGDIEDYIDEIIKADHYTDFYVEDALFVSVYDKVANTTPIATYVSATQQTYNLVPKALEDCEFVVWQYISSGEYVTIKGTDGAPAYVGGSYNEVYALINYYIYDIEVYTDAGIKAVSIDGVEMFNETNNKFTSLSNLAAGTHTVTYTIKAGYQEDKNGVNLYTSDGIILQNYKFVVSGDAGTTKLLLNGTELIPEPEPTPAPEKESEWNVTTILLLVLVILIAIMAVIVALRLNRS